MIKMDPLYLLLLVELSCILAGCLIILLLRYRKYRSLYQEALKDLSGTKQLQEDLRKKLALARSSTPVAPAAEQVQEHKGAEGADGVEALRTKLRSVEEELKAKNHKMEQLQSKFADLEKEYMVLYQQQQSQQQEQPKIP